MRQKGNNSGEPPCALAYPHRYRIRINFQFKGVSKSVGHHFAFLHFAFQSPWKLWSCTNVTSRFQNNVDERQCQFYPTLLKISESELELRSEKRIENLGRHANQSLQFELHHYSVEKQPERFEDSKFFLQLTSSSAEVLVSTHNG